MVRLHRRFANEHRSAGAPPYEGETIRLDPEHEPAGERMKRSKCGAFPWWTLWLIWPLFGPIKWLVMNTMTTLASLGSAAVEYGLFSLWPLALIIIGVWLLRRR
jgi:hypothetical protein